jgi:hypothetical protein
MKKFALIFIVTLLLLAPVASFAAGLVPCGGPGDKYAKCDFNTLMIMINGLIDFLLFKISLPIAAIVFAYVGFLILFSGGDEGKHKQARSIATNLVFGIVIALVAWLIVKTILVGLGLCEGYHLLENFTGRSCPK